INLTENDPRRAKINLMTEDYSPRKTSLASGDYRAGFQVNDNFTIGVGVGPASNFFFENASGLQNLFWAQVGLMPERGSALASAPFVKRARDLRNLPPMTVPSSARDLRTWSNGDNVNYVSTGGLVFFSNVGLSIASAGVTSVAQGKFETYVEKVDGRHAFVDI